MQHFFAAHCSEQNQAPSARTVIGRTPMSSLQGWIHGVFWLKVPDSAVRSTSAE